MDVLERLLPAYPMGSAVVGGGGGAVAVDNSMQISVKTDNTGTSNDDQFTLPAVGGPFDVTDWGDGESSLAVSGSQTHTYDSIGTYTIYINKITNNFQPCKFVVDGDKAKLLDVLQWGNIVWDNADLSFKKCSNLDISATDIPDMSNCTDFTEICRDCTSLTSFPLIDVSSATTFYVAWYGCSALESFPLLVLPAGLTVLTWAWYGCSTLTSFPLLNTSGATNFNATWSGCTGLTAFPEIDTGAGTDFGSTWSGCTGLTAFPLLDFTSATSLIYAWNSCTFTSFPLIVITSSTTVKLAWRYCAGLTSFPIIDTSAVTDFYAAWQGATGLDTVPLLDTGAGTNFQYTWYGKGVIDSFPGDTQDMGAMTLGLGCFQNSTLTTSDYSDLLVNLETNNQNASVTFHGGSSLYSAGAAATARAALIADHSWTITDGGEA
jgi:hypothetical protein